MRWGGAIGEKPWELLLNPGAHIKVPLFVYSIPHQLTNMLYSRQKTNLTLAIREPTVEEGGLASEENHSTEGLTNRGRWSRHRP